MTTSTTNSPTPAQRSAIAAAAAARRFTFTNEKLMLAALSEIALDELSRNPSFAARVRDRYQELTPTKTPKAPKAPKEPRVKLIPIKEIPGYRLDVARRLDPWFILEYYGEAQLETALRIQTIGNLREAIEIVEERYPGTTPKGKLTKDAAISYILEYVLRK